MSSMTLSPNGNGSQETQNWLQSSVQTFFATCNWDNQSIEVQSLKLSALTEVETELALNLSVQDFFAAVNWDGTSLSSPALAPAQDLFEPAESDDGFTLTDFSDLF